MPSKTDRILMYLPPTFRALPRPTALYALADAFGNELLQAENCLAAVMLAHWVDHADLGADQIADLACIAALYGLAPRGVTPRGQPSVQRGCCPPLVSDEAVEEFREHLKRYVRTFLEGTVTVQGVLRVTAEALGLRIADAYSDMDTWWTRQDDMLITIEPRGNDAADLLFGVRSADISGSTAMAARAVGTNDLSGGVDLRAAPVLRLKLDAAAPVDIDLLPHVGVPAAATLDEIAASVDAVLGVGAASHDGRYLTIASPTIGSASRLEVQEVDGDAAPLLLGLAPLTYRGTAASAASVTGTTVDLSGGADLRDERYLRLLVDGTRLAEIDCAGANPAATTLDEVASAINAGLGVGVATHDGRRLTLTSPTTGSASSIAFQAPAAQDATARLFGAVNAFHAGTGARSAELIGTCDLSQGADLSARSRVRLRLDDRAPVTVDLAATAVDPSHVSLAEIVAALNAALGLGVAALNQQFVRVRSPSSGADGQIVVEALPADQDATELVFGIGPRVFRGVDATRARLAGTPDLRGGVNLMALHVVRIGLDGGEPIEIDLWCGPADPGAATLDELVAALNAALGLGIASHDGSQLVLASPTDGAGGRITVEPLERTLRRRFVTRAFVIEEAAQAIFGFVQGDARGTPPSAAQVASEKDKIDLSRGVDLRATPFLRIGVDSGLVRDIDLAASPFVPRPRATLPAEIVEAINAVFGSDIASHDGRHLALTSPTPDPGSRIAFEPPRIADALDAVLGVGLGSFRGRDATQVIFEGTVDLSAGLDLRAGDRVKIGVDGAAPVEIACAGSDPANTTLNQIVIAINLALGAVIASHNGQHAMLRSPSAGPASQVVFEMPGSADATSAIFGVDSGRAYRGAAASGARVVGDRDLSGGADLRVARFMRVAVDGQPAVDVDCAATASDPSQVTLDKIVAAIGAVSGAPAASHDGTRLTLRSALEGAAARLELLPYDAGDARAVLFGDVDPVTVGKVGQPAVIEGTVDLLAPVNLAERNVIRLAVDGGRAVDVDVAGAAPGTTFGDEIVARINAVFPGLAAIGSDDRLRLTSPTTGGDSRLELLPSRVLEVVEYPPEPVAEPPRGVRHGDRWTLANDGAAATDLKVELRAPFGTVGPALVNHTSGWRVQLRVAIPPGEHMRLWRDYEHGLRATIYPLVGTPRPVPEADIVVEQLIGRRWIKPANRSAGAAALRLVPGRSDWTYIDCYGPRYDQDRVGAARFAGSACTERGVFDASRFAVTSHDPEGAVFTPVGPLTDPPAEIRLEWSRYRLGAFSVNLTADLPERFGGRFDEARFGRTGDAPETFGGIVIEPTTDPDFVVTRVNAGSILVDAAMVSRVPIGFDAVAIPFRQPRVRELSSGSASEPARLYLGEDDVPGFVELRARWPGALGNAIGVSVRKAGPARYDLTIAFEGAYFESARQVALGEPVHALSEDLLQPGSVGVLQAKSAGVHVSVMRDRTESTPTSNREVE